MVKLHSEAMKQDFLMADWNYIDKHLYLQELFLVYVYSFESYFIL